MARSRSAPHPYDAECITAAKQWIGKRSVAIFACAHSPANATEEPADTAMHKIGSGTLLEIASDAFLVTAAHVADETISGDYVLAIGPRARTAKPIPLLKTRIVSTELAKNRRREQDDVDVAVLTLAADIRQELRHYFKFARIHDMDLDYTPDPEDVVGVFGFPNAAPWTWAGSGGGPSYKDLLVVARLEVHPSAKLTRKHRSDSLFVQYPRRRMYHNNSDRDAPDPHAMSGGGLWALHRPRHAHGKWSTCSIRWIGVLHQYEREHGLLVNSPIFHAVKYAQQAVPSIVPALNLARPRST